MIDIVLDIVIFCELKTKVQGKRLQKAVEKLTIMQLADSKDIMKC